MQDGGRVAITNALCPVLPDEEVDPEIFSEYRGTRVYLCCRKCLKKFAADPAAYVSNLPPGFFGDESEGGKGQPDSAHPRSSALVLGAQTTHEPVEETHVHSEDVAPGAVREWIARIGRLHPISIHFPIALLISAALVEVLVLVRAFVGAEPIVRFCLWLGSISAVAAAALGWADAVGVGNDYSGFEAQILTYHRWSGTASAALALLVLVAWERARRRASPAARKWSRALVIACATLVSATGYLGGSLIYGWNHLFE